MIPALGMIRSGIDLRITIEDVQVWVRDHNTGCELAPHHSFGESGIQYVLDEEAAADADPEDLEDQPTAPREGVDVWVECLGRCGSWLSYHDYCRVTGPDQDHGPADPIPDGARRLAYFGRTIGGHIYLDADGLLEPIGD